MSDMDDTVRWVVWVLPGKLSEGVQQGDDVGFERWIGALSPPVGWVVEADLNVDQKENILRGSHPSG